MNSCFEHAQVPSYITLPLRSTSSSNPYVKSFPLGMQTTIFGPQVALYGQIGNVSMFQEPLTTAQVRLLYETGESSYTRAVVVPPEM